MCCKKLVWLGLFFFVLLNCPLKAQKLLLGGSGWDKIVIIDKETKAIEWEYPMRRGWECNSVAFASDGDILFSYRKGAKLITRSKDELWKIEAPDGCEMQTAMVLPNGNFLLAWCGSPAVILEVDPRGEILSKTEFDTQIEDSHSQFRQVIRNKDGNYVIPLLATSEICEVSIDGQLLRSIKIGGNPFSAAPLENGNYLIACGDAHCYKELNFRTGEVVNTVTRDDIAGARLFFVAQLLPLANGNTYICNWQGHSHIDGSVSYPQLVEVNSEGEMVWSLNDNAAFGMISAISIID